MQPLFILHNCPFNWLKTRKLYSLPLAMMRVKVFLFLATVVLSSCHADKVFNPLIHLLRPRDHLLDEVDCLSWRLAVETNNLQDWEMVPQSCEDYVGNYMLGKQYRHDCKLVADTAIEYAQSLNLTGDGMDVWVFDVDETTLSNLPYYASSDVQFGALPYNRTKFYEWLAEETAPAIPDVQRLYKTVLSLGFKTVFLTGTAESIRDMRTANLRKAGYRNWDKLILKGDADKGLSAIGYKSKKRTELVNAGYRIVGNVGDQWSDLLGPNAGNRTFKVPDPMYYVG